MKKWVAPALTYDSTTERVHQKDYIVAMDKIMAEAKVVFPDYVFAGHTNSEVVLNRYSLNGLGERFVSFHMRVHSAEIHRLYLLLKKDGP